MLNLCKSGSGLFAARYDRKRRDTYVDVVIGSNPSASLRA
jgi:hypothetical protein